MDFGRDEFAVFAGNRRRRRDDMTNDYGLRPSIYMEEEVAEMLG